MKYLLIPSILFAAFASFSAFADSREEQETKARVVGGTIAGVGAAQFGLHQMGVTGTREELQRMTDAYFNEAKSAQAEIADLTKRGFKAESVEMVKAQHRLDKADAVYHEAVRTPHVGELQWVRERYDMAPGGKQLKALKGLRNVGIGAAAYYYLSPSEESIERPKLAAPAEPEAQSPANISAELD